MPQHPIHQPAGFLRIATIQEVNMETMSAKITFGLQGKGASDVSLRDKKLQIFDAQLPISYLSAGGGFIGGKIAPGTPVVVGQAEGGARFFIVSFLVQDPSTGNTSLNKNIIIPERFDDNTLYLQATSNGFIKLNDTGIIIGNLDNSYSFNTNLNLSFNTFDSFYSVTQGVREVNGLVLRDKQPNINYNSDFFRLKDPSYNYTLKEIGMDPIANTTTSTYGSVARNPGRIEKRELILEYEDAAQVLANDQELNFYNPNNYVTQNLNIVNRRQSRADTLSLSLVAPNYLMETIKGTVVDTFGNILDLNRNVIPLGKDNLSVVKIKSTLNEPQVSQNIYESIKQAERKSLAYHFEINARKESQGSGPPDVTTRNNWARDRSRFFLDIDKEGQFKLNVPASSSTGNIPLLTRYENYSTIYPNSSSNDPNDLSFNPAGNDILIESFANGEDGNPIQPISLFDENNNSSGPIDRFSSSPNNHYIGHGTAYHDITQTISSSTSEAFYSPLEYTATTPLGSGTISALTDIVSKNIIISGPSANAGGRSGSLNFDGSLDLNIGMNEIDSQSLWIDTEGGIVANVGEDNQGISLAASLDGNIFLELGKADGISGKVFDLKVADGVGNMTCFRIDNSGMSVSTQGRLVFYSSGDMLMRCGGTFTVDSESAVINGRSVIKDIGGGPIR